MAGPVDVEEQDILNGILQDPPYAGYATLHIGLSTTTPTETGTTFTEPATGAYARVATTGADWGPATGSAPAIKATTAVKTFPTATANWGTVTHSACLPLPLAAPRNGGRALDASRVVNSSDIASFAAGALSIKLGDPTDVY